MDVDIDSDKRDSVQYSDALSHITKEHNTICNNDFVYITISVYINVSYTIIKGYDDPT